MSILAETWAAARAWLFEAVLPLWSTVGRDLAGGGYYDEILPDLRPNPKAKRCRVQGRQTYVFWAAGEMGWQGPVEALVRAGAEALLADYRKPNGLFRSEVAPDGRHLDEAQDNYDQAFALFGLAQAHRLTGEARYREAAGACLAALERLKAHPAGGFEEQGAAPLPLLANPHMHLLEAALAWCAADADPAWGQLADRLAALALAHFVDPASGALLELFDADWHPWPGGGALFWEPGHQYEWGWLLARWSALRGRSLPPEAPALIDLAEARGLGPDGLPVNRVALDGRHLDPRARLWPHSERLKAMLALARLRPEERPHYEAAAAASWRALGLYAGDLPPGLWRDQRAPDGSLDEAPSKASSLYHIACAALELQIYLRGR